MITTFHQKRIRGVLPENEYDYDEETKPFQDIHTKRLKRIMGYGKRRAAKSKTTTSDLCVYGFDYVLKHNWIKKEEIGAVVVVTISPDHYVPHVSNIIHGEFDLPHDVVCVDIPQACAGYIMGLMEAICQRTKKLYYLPVMCCAGKRRKRRLLIQVLVVMVQAYLLLKMIRRRAISF